MRRILVLIVGLAAIGLAFPAVGPAQAAAQPGAVAAMSDEDASVAVPAPSEKALRYYRSGNVLWFVNLAWGCVVPLFFLFTGLSARIRNWAQKLGRRWFFVIGIYGIIFLVLNFLIGLPLAYYEEFVRQHAYGLSNQRIEKWLGDSVKGLMVGAVVALLFLWVPYLLLKTSPRRWWFYCGLLFVPFLIVTLLVSPIWIDPLYNKFGPMHDRALEAKILTLANRAGIEGGRVYEVNKSVDTKAVNAYVTGFGRTKRIVLWDTIIARLSERELLVVMGHEMGHYVLGHVRNGIIFASVLMMVALYLAYRLAHGVIDRFKHRFGFDALSDVASLPLLLLLAGIFLFLMSPLSMAYSRYQEHEADRFALEITRTNRSAAVAFVKLQEENLSVPRPGLLYKLWRASHPPIGERIDFCNEYRPWKTGQPLKYEHYFKRPAKGD